MKILLTAFDPFGGETVNPAFEAVSAVTAPNGVELIRLEVPTVFGTSVEVVRRAVETTRPDIVVCVGQAGGRKEVTVERVAVNLMDATIPDNAGYMPTDEPIDPAGETAYFSTLPVRQIVRAIEETGIPARLSYTAGTFVCNQLLYGVLALTHRRFPDIRAGFIHVPFLPSQVTERPEYPSMPLPDIVTALNATLRCLSEEGDR